MMTESKIELTHRLQREGRWNEASEFRDKVRQEQRKAGRTRIEANEDAWERMAENFPRLPDSKPSGEEMDSFFADESGDSDLPADLLVGDGNFEADLQWAYRNFCSDVTRNDAPSGAAWALRQWGRDPDSRDKFLNFVAKTQLRSRDAEDRLKDDGQRQFELLSLFGPMSNAASIAPHSQMSVTEAINRLSKLPPMAMMILDISSCSSNRPESRGPRRDFLNEPVD